MDRYIFKIEDRRTWDEAMDAGIYRGSDHDKRDGFIHFSDASQVAGTYEKHFAGRTDLSLICVDSDLYRDQLKWEVGRGGDLFPHLYGELDVEAVRAVADIPDNLEPEEISVLVSHMRAGVRDRLEEEDGDAGSGDGGGDGGGGGDAG